MTQPHGFRLIWMAVLGAHLADWAMVAPLEQQNQLKNQ